MGGWVNGWMIRRQRQVGGFGFEAFESNQPHRPDWSRSIIRPRLRLTLHRSSSITAHSLFSVNTDKKPFQTLILFICLFSFVSFLLWIIGSPALALCWRILGLIALKFNAAGPLIPA